MNSSNNTSLNYLEIKEPILKRPFDIILSIFGIALSMPLWLILAFAIYVDGGMPIFFLQERCGRKGKRFQSIKYRTMKTSIYGSNEIMDIEGDHRITRIGRMLRATSMDELPGLINILKGDMSFVGPRTQPFRIDGPEKALYANISDVPGYYTRGSIRPGLTGIAQIYLPRDTSRIIKFQYDNAYISQMGFFLDIKLIFLSLWVTFKGKWEHRGKKL